MDPTGDLAKNHEISVQPLKQRMDTNQPKIQNLIDGAQRHKDGMVDKKTNIVASETLYQLIRFSRFPTGDHTER